MQVVILGAGYVGLVSGACFAEFGANVTCVDVDEQRVAALSNGLIPIYEPGLEGLVQRNVHQAKLRFSKDIAGSLLTLAASQFDLATTNSGTLTGSTCATTKARRAFTQFHAQRDVLPLNRVPMCNSAQGQCHSIVFKTSEHS